MEVLTTELRGNRVKATRRRILLALYGPVQPDEIPLSLMRTRLVEVDDAAALMTSTTPKSLKRL